MLLSSEAGTAGHASCIVDKEVLNGNGDSKDHNKVKVIKNVLKYVELVRSHLAGIDFIEKMKVDEAVEQHREVDALG